jgi:hypothetical protein
MALTSAQEALREFLIDMATRHADPMSYGIMSKAVDPDGRLGFRDGGQRSQPLINALYHVNKDAYGRGEPMLGALAVGKSSGTSGSGFVLVGREVGFNVERTTKAETAFWQDQLDRTYEYWGKKQDTPKGEDEPMPDKVDAQIMAAMDAHFTAVMNELVTIKRLLRRLLHGEPPNQD